VQEYLAVLKKYVAFNGRAGRREYWMFVLISFLIGVALSILDTILGTKTNGQGMLSSLYSLAVFLPGLSVAFRRLHDTNRSGWWVLISFIPVIGWIWIIVILASSGDEGDNQYGAKPVQITA
jgi:uncharacterized membrane protein YhaH (DUF805 family)